MPFASKWIYKPERACIRKGTISTNLGPLYGPHVRYNSENNSYILRGFGAKLVLIIYCTTVCGRFSSPVLMKEGERTTILSHAWLSLFYHGNSVQIWPPSSNLLPSQREACPAARAGGGEGAWSEESIDRRVGNVAVVVAVAAAAAAAPAAAVAAARLCHCCLSVHILRFLPPPL